MFKALILMALFAGPALAQDRLVEVINPRGEQLRSEQFGTSPDLDIVAIPASGLHTANSSTVPLAALATTTGTFFNMTQYSGATISILADADGTLKIDSSLDGINTDFTAELTISSGVLFFAGGTPASKFLRIRYENGATAQTKFSLIVIPKVSSINPIFRLLGSILTDADRSQVVRSIIAGKDVLTGEYVAVGVQEDRLRVVSPPPETPTGSTDIDREITGDQSGSTDDVFVIPSGSTITLQRLSGGSEAGASGGKVELFFDQLCTAVTLIFLEVIYTNGSSDNFVLGDEFVGDGTACIRLRRSNNGGGSLDMFAKWVGFTTP